MVQTGDGVGDLGGGLRGERGELLHFAGHHGEAVAGRASAGGFYGGVEGQEFGLAGHGGDEVGHLLDLVQAVAEVMGHLIGGASPGHQVVGDVVGGDGAGFDRLAGGAHRDDLHGDVFQLGGDGLGGLIDQRLGALTVITFGLALFGVRFLEFLLLLAFTGASLFILCGYHIEHLVDGLRQRSDDSRRGRVDT